MSVKRERGSNKSKGICKLSIDEDMTIYTIDTLKQGISEEIDNYNRFELNLAEVEEADSAGIQLILAFNRELQQKEKQLTITAVSAAVGKLITTYGIDDQFSVGTAS